MTMVYERPGTAQRLDLIRDFDDFPRPGITFKDLSPLLADPAGFAAAIEEMRSAFDGAEIDAVVGIEARGFVFGAAVSVALGVGFVPARKSGKLPGPTVRECYELEYAEACLEMQADAGIGGRAVLVVDDVLATGGTAAAAVRLVERLGGRVAGLAFVVEISGLGGRKRLMGHNVLCVQEAGY